MCVTYSNSGILWHNWIESAIYNVAINFKHNCRWDTHRVTWALISEACFYSPDIIFLQILLISDPGVYLCCSNNHWLKLRIHLPLCIVDISSAFFFSHFCKQNNIFSDLGDLVLLFDILLVFSNLFFFFSSVIFNVFSVLRIMLVCIPKGELYA